MLTSEREKEIRCIVDTPSPLTSWHRYTQAIRDLLAEIDGLHLELMREKLQPGKPVWMSKEDMAVIDKRSRLQKQKEAP